MRLPVFVLFYWYSINASAEMSAQDKFFNGLNQAVMVIVQRRDKIGGLFYIRIRVCHCHACARSQKHGNIVGGRGSTERMSEAVIRGIWIRSR